MLIGVIGKPNTGKSTFFKALTLAECEIANYPFATIKPHHGVGFVEIDCVDKEFNVQCTPKEGYCKHHKRFVPVEMLDVAGLVPGAHEGKGMGNQFLNDLNQADALIHVVDVAGTTNEKGEPVEALSYDPVADVKFLEIELDYWYLTILRKGWEKFARQVQQEHGEIEKALTKQLSGMHVDEDMVKRALKKLELSKDQPAKWTDEQMLSLATYLRKKSKPMIIAANKIDIPGAKENLKKLHREFPEYIIIGCSAESELAMKEATKHALIDYTPGESDFIILKEDLNDKQKNALDFLKKFLERNKTTGVEDVLNKTVFELLKCIAVFPVPNAKLTDKDGNILPDCFLVPDGTTSLDLAYRIHSDIGDKYVKAMDIKTKQVIAKDHQLKTGDVIEILTQK
ncbi:MAG: redox-regulated ATPase YchF [archaeon]